MTEIESEGAGLNDAVKASLINAGVIGQLKQALHWHKPEAADDIHALRQDAKAMTEALQSLLDSGRLDDTVSLKLSGVLSRLKGVLQGSNISREALSSVLSEAASTMNTAESSGKGNTPVTLEQLWKQVEGYNHDINDDFEKMRKAGVLFDEKLWNKHKQLLEQLRLHPHDINNQKELNAVDDQLLHQAQPQLDHCPGAKDAFDDAKKKSDDRRKVVDHDLQIAQHKSLEIEASTDNEWDMHVQKNQNSSVLTNVTMDDITLQKVGQKPKPASKTLS